MKNYVAGFSGLFSTGAGGTRKIAGRIPGAKHFRHTQWRTAVDEIVSLHDANQLGRVCIFGHSMGGEAVLEIAQAVAKKGITVDYMGVIDLTYGRTTPAGSNIRLLQEFYAAYNKVKFQGFRGTHKFFDLDEITGRNIGHTPAAKLEFTQKTIISTVADIVGGKGKDMPDKPFYMGEFDPLEDEDFIELAKEYNLDEAHVRAVVEVESNGKGSHSSGALVALNEPHWVWNTTSGALRNKLANTTVRIGGASWKLAHKYRRGQKYPPTSYPRIDKVVEVVAANHKGGQKAGIEIAALSTSWGLGQIMGFNHKLCGFSSAADMAQEFSKGEYYQLKGMLEFIKTKGILDDLRAGRWDEFAKGYNGEDYRDRNYHGRLKNAYVRWVERIKDRGDIPVIPPIKPPVEEKEIDWEIIEAKIEMAQNLIKDYQAELDSIFAEIRAEMRPERIPDKAPIITQMDPASEPGFLMPETKGNNEMTTFNFLNVKSKTFWVGAAMSVAGLIQMIAPGTPFADMAVSIFGSTEPATLLMNGLAIVFGREAIEKVAN